MVDPRDFAFGVSPTIIIGNWISLVIVFIDCRNYAYFVDAGCGLPFAAAMRLVSMKLKDAKEGIRTSSSNIEERWL